MSAEQDRKFFDVFMVVLGSLVAVAVGIYALAQVVQARTQEEYMKADAVVQAQVAERQARMANYLRQESGEKKERKRYFVLMLYI